MKQYYFDLSTKIYYGTEIIKNVIESETDVLKGTILLVSTGGSLKKLGYIEELISYLKTCEKCKNIIVFDKISQNPKLEEVKAGICIGKENNIDVVIGFGGGSAIDAAKAIAVGIPIEEDIEKYLLEGKEPGKETLPIIAIPTTAGTGSELSQGAILSSPKHHFKGGIRGKYILPKIAIVDSKYTWTIPRKIAMETGFDVLAHAIETYMAEKATPFSEMLSEKAICLAAENLTKIFQNEEDYKAREQMCFASMLMGMNLATVGTCLPHRMQYPIGAETDTSHGAGLLAIYPSWIAHEQEVNPQKVDQVMKWLKLGKCDSSLEVKVKFTDFLKQLECNYQLIDLGIISKGDDENYYKLW